MEFSNQTSFIIIIISRGIVPILSLAVRGI